MIFLRHPRPEAPPGLCYGRRDLPAGPEAKAEIVRALALTPPVTRVLASPARRCRGLAEALAARDGATLVLDERLWELDFGSWEGRRWWDIPRAESDPWAADPWRLAPLGGERFAELHARIATVLAEVGTWVGAGLGTGTRAGVALVTHAGPIRAARMILSGESFERVFAEPVPYATPLCLVRESA